MLMCEQKGDHNHGRRPHPMTGLSIKKNLLWNSAGSFSYSLCQWVLTVLVVRLSPNYDAAGVLALGMAVSNVAAPIALYKIRSYQVSDVHRTVSAREYVGFRIITTVIALFATVVYTLITCSPDTYVAVLLYVVFRSGDTFIDVLHGVDQQHFRMDYCGRSMLVRGLLFLAAFALTLWISESLELAIFSMIVATFPVIIYDVRKASSLDDVRPLITAFSVKKLALECLPAVVGMVCCFSVATIARQYLATTWGDASLGIYASVCTPVVIIQACASYIYAPLLGVFAQKYDERDTAGFLGLLGKASTAILVVFVAAAIGFSLLGEPLLRLVFGESIVPYSYLLIPAIICSGVAAYIAFLGDLLIAVRQMQENLIANVAAFAACLPATWFCVNTWDMNGASFATIIAYSIGAALMALFLVKNLRSRKTKNQ